MSTERLHELSPEEKNEALYVLHVRDLAKKLVGKEIARFDNPEQRIKVEETVAHGKKEEGVEEVGTNPMYKSQHDRKPGEVTIYDWKFRKTKLFLVNSAGEDPATCVWIKRGSIYDPGSEVFTPTTTAKAPVDHLNLSADIIYRLGYKDSSETLYIEEIEDTSLSSDDANSALKNLRNS